MTGFEQGGGSGGDFFEDEADSEDSSEGGRDDETREHANHEASNTESTGDTNVTSESSTRVRDTPSTVADLDVTQNYDPSVIAQAITDPEFDREDVGVPYGMWRDGTSTGRGRTTIELNPNVDKLVRQAQSEFEDEYGTVPNKADIRELALVFGLLHLEDLFAMAEEWGLQHG